MKTLNRLLAVAVVLAAAVMAIPSRPRIQTAATGRTNLSVAETSSCGDCWGGEASCAQCHMMCFPQPSQVDPMNTCVNCANYTQYCSDMPWQQLTAADGKMLRMIVGYDKRRMPADHGARAAAVIIKEIHCKTKAPIAVSAKGRK